MTPTQEIPAIIEKAKMDGCENADQINGYLAAEISRLRWLLETLPRALYDSTNVCVMGDGCSTRDRDEWILGDIIRQHFVSTARK